MKRIIPLLRGLELALANTDRETEKSKVYVNFYNLILEAQSDYCDLEGFEKFYQKYQQNATSELSNYLTSTDIGVDSGLVEKAQEVEGFLRNNLSLPSPGSKRYTTETLKIICQRELKLLKEFGGKLNDR